MRTFLTGPKRAFASSNVTGQFLSPLPSASIRTFSETCALSGSPSAHVRVRVCICVCVCGRLWVCTCTLECAGAQTCTSLSRARQYNSSDVCISFTINSLSEVKPVKSASNECTGNPVRWSAASTETAERDRCSTNTHRT
jgi:hypothetical protein